MISIYIHVKEEKKIGSMFNLFRVCIYIYIYKERNNNFFLIISLQQVA